MHTKKTAGHKTPPPFFNASRHYDNKPPVCLSPRPRPQGNILLPPQNNESASGVSTLGALLRFIRFLVSSAPGQLPGCRRSRSPRLWLPLPGFAGLLPFAGGSASGRMSSRRMRCYNRTSFSFPCKPCNHLAHYYIIRENNTQCATCTNTAQEHCAILHLASTLRNVL